MFQELHLLPDDPNNWRKYTERWQTEEGRRLEDYVVDKIKKGAGEDFLQWDYQQGKLPILENEWDLKGIKLFSLDIDFPERDTFEAINFSYGSFWHSSFKNAVFLSNSGGHFVRIYNCKFNRCIFYFSYWYGCTFEKVVFHECDFIDHVSFTNCRFIDCKFEGCFIPKNIFSSCLFDVNTRIDGLAEKEIHGDKQRMDNRELPELYKGIKDAYLAGQVYDKYREYFFNQKVSERKHLKKGFSKIIDILKEGTTRYGIGPVNVVLTALLVIALFAFVYQIFDYSYYDSIIMSMGAFSTMGNIPKRPLDIIYLIEAGFGIALFALFVTVLANVWFSEK